MLKVSEKRIKKDMHTKTRRKSTKSVARKHYLNQQLAYPERHPIAFASNTNLLATPLLPLLTNGVIIAARVVASFQDASF